MSGAYDVDRQKLIAWRLSLWVMMRQRKQRIGFGIIGRATTLRNIIGYDAKAADRAQFAVIQRGHQIGRVAFFETETRDVGLIHKKHPTRALNPTEPITVPVDRRVELIVRTQGGEVQHLYAGFQLEIGKQPRGRDEIRLLVVRDPFAFPRGQRTRKPAGLK